MVDIQRRQLLMGGAGFVAATGLGVAGLVSRRSQRSNSSFVRIERATLTRINDRWLFDGLAMIDLPAPIKTGLESGVPLQFIVSVRVTSPNSLWFDNVLLESVHRFRLVYYELTRHYRVYSVDTDTSVNKRSLLSALDELGTFNFLDLTSSVKRASDLHNPGVEKIATVSIFLDRQYLPLPLQPVFSSGWRLSSEDFSWPLS